ncbi:vascular cell adhesion protein 1-like isoform X5 [Acanthopagrus latus]|uniref:vascular cell adhesion protein 1-like isoform X5 n=1 Tax=Acanthopagrus latus TaxID=8177 RepID=UPI00187CA08D|nr:vascular cell adhesion protein 1-like isoform X5 [Acanthopagrus latus]
MAAALTVLLIGCLLQTALCGQFKTIIPQTIKVLSGSCVTIPCSFDVEDQYISRIDGTCRAMWKSDEQTVVFDSSNPQSSAIQGELKGDLTRRDCSTTLNNMRPEHSKEYLLRVQCDVFKHSFRDQKLHISVTDDPPTPTLTPSTLKVEEGTSVSLKCSAPAPCLSHPPALTWTSSLVHIQESLQENLDRTKVQTSVLTFTASRLHHGKIISCTAVYNKQDGSSQSVSTSLTADVSLSSQFIILPQTIEVLSGSCVTIPCSFDVEDTYKSNVDETCRAVWKNDQGTVVFNSRDPQTTGHLTGHLTGNLTNRDCTTTLNNMRPENSMKYFFGLECDNGLEYDFKTRHMDISVKDDPPTPTLTPSTLKVEEGTSVSLKCSAPAPCLSHPPALTWTSSLGHIQDSLQENHDRTKVQTSVLTFTASRLHHGKIISCTAVYNKQDGSSQSVSTSLTADVSLSSQFITFMPQTIEVLSGSCVTIPCSFGVEDKYKTKEDETCRAVWKSDQGTVVFNSRNPQTTGHLTGNLTNRDCTTTLNNMRPENSMKYFFRLECDGVKYDFLEKQVDISVKDDPPTPTLTPSTLKVEEGTSVSLKCSAPAPCLSHPPALTWTSSLGYIQDSLQENLDRTKVQTSILNFTASRLHHGQIISCTAVYNKQDGSSQSVSTSLTADVSYSPKHTTVSVSPSGPVPENSIVTLTCSSTANPAVRSYTWYRADGGQETVMGTGHVLNIKASRDIGPFFCEAENAIGSGRSNISQIDVHIAPQILSSYGCIQTADQLNCSCETVGNPPPALQWYLDGLPVNHSDRFATSSEPLNISGLRSIITVSQPQQRDLSTLLCHSSNSLGSATQRFCVNNLEPQISAKHQDFVMLLVFITIIVALFLIICGLLLVIRAQRTHQVVHKSTVAMSQVLTSGEADEEPNAEEEAIYINTNEARQGGVAEPAANSEPNSANLPGEEGSDVIYSSVNWKTKSRKRKEEDSEQGSAW